MTTVQSSYGFTLSSQGENKVFTYQHEKYQTKHLYPSLFGLSLLSLISLAFLQPHSLGSAFIMWIIVTSSIFVLVKFLMNLNRHEGIFSISKDAFEVDGKKYARKDITDLYYREGKMDAIASQNFHSTIIVGGSVSSSIMATSAMNAAHSVGNSLELAGAKFRNNLAKINCKVYIRYGNKNIMIAKGLTSDTAELLMDKITEVCKQEF